MRRSILDIASVKENITPVQISIVLSPAPTGLQPLGGELPRLNPGLSFQGPSGRHADSSDTPTRPTRPHTHTPTRPHAHTPTRPHADMSRRLVLRSFSEGGSIRGSERRGEAATQDSLGRSPRNRSLTPHALKVRLSLHLNPRHIVHGKSHGNV
jgi:hypothetical protein